MTDRDERKDRILRLIGDFNKKGIEVAEDTRFAQDLEWDSLTVMDFVAAVEDEFDIIITMNRAAEIETVGALIDAVGELEGAGMTDPGLAMIAEPATLRPRGHGARPVRQVPAADRPARGAAVDRRHRPVQPGHGAGREPDRRDLQRQADDPARHLQLHGPDVRPGRARRRPAGAGRVRRGTTGSRVLNGTYQGHRECEEALKRFYGMDHAMVFSTGYQANLGIISTMAGKDDYVILDIDSHASIYDGCALGNAQIVAFRHNDVEALEKRLKRLPAEAGKLVVLEGVYSMLGDTAPLKEMVAISKAHGAMVLVDEAHSMGFIGPNGRGVAEEQGVLDDVDFVIGTFSKSVGTVGGFCVSNHPKFEILRLVCRPYVFTASLPPSVVATAATSIDLLRGAGQARASVGEQPAAARRAEAARLHARHRDAAVGDHRGDHARPRARRGHVGSAAAGGAVREPRPAAGDPGRHDPAALLALRAAQRGTGGRDPRHVRSRGQARRGYLTVSTASSPVGQVIDALVIGKGAAAAGSVGAALQRAIGDRAEEDRRAAVAAAAFGAAHRHPA
jgi:acyl carrier protein